MTRRARLMPPACSPVIEPHVGPSTALHDAREAAFDDVDHTDLADADEVSADEAHRAALHEAVEVAVRLCDDGELADAPHVARRARVDDEAEVQEADERPVGAPA